MKKSWWFAVLISAAIMLPFLLPYLALDPNKSRIAITSAAIQYPALLGHIATACLAMLSGFLQVRPGLRNKRPSLHVRLGKVYVGCVTVSGILAGVMIAYEPDYGRALSFLALDVLWLLTAWKGAAAAKRSDPAAHRRWMIRSFAFTLTAVSARAVVPPLILAYLALHGFSVPDGRAAMIEEVLDNNIWAALVLNLAIVEWGLLKPRTSGTGASRPST